MSAVLKPHQFPDAEAYLAWEDTQVERHEYLDGQTYAMVGARLEHNTITINVITWLKQSIRGSPCRIYSEAAKLRLSQAGDFAYPDVMVTCDPRDRRPGENRFIAHPWLIVEVLSDSTAAYDRGRKFELYRQIDTLTHYLLVEQDRQHADLFFKNDLGQWVLQSFDASEQILIERLGQPWPLATVYEDVDFAPPPSSDAGPTV